MKNKKHIRNPEEMFEMKERKEEYKKEFKLISIQESLIEMLGNYVRRTEEITREVQKEMFPKMKPEPCDCCGEPVYPIIKFLHDYEFVYDNFESLEVEDIEISLSPMTEEPEESEQSVGLLN